MKYRVEYTEDLPEKFGGYVELPSILMRVLGDIPTIKIRPKYENDKGLLNHELKHVEQYSKNIFHNILYTFVRSYRYRCELEAYTEQIKEYKYTSITQAFWIVDSLASKYGLHYVYDDILDDVNNIIRKLREVG